MASKKKRVISQSTWKGNTDSENAKPQCSCISYNSAITVSTLEKKKKTHININ